MRSVSLWRVALLVLLVGALFTMGAGPCSSVASQMARSSGSGGGSSSDEEASSDQQDQNSSESSDESAENSDQNDDQLAYGSNPSKSDEGTGREPYDSVESDGIQNEFHKKHKGEIVFSDESLSNDPDPDQLKTEFSLDDKMYMRAFFRESPANLFRQNGYKEYSFGDGNPTVKLAVHRGEMDFDLPTFSEDSLDSTIEKDKETFIESEEIGYPEEAWKTRTISGFGKGSLLAREGGEVVRVTDEGVYGFQFVAGKLIPRMPPMGPTKLSFVLVAGPDRAETTGNSYDSYAYALLAKGTVTVDIASGKAKHKLYKKYGPKLPASKHRNANVLERKVIKYSEQEFDKTIQEATFPHNSGWNINRNDRTGRPVERWMNAYIAKPDSDTSYCEWNKVSVYQQHQGGGNYTNHITNISFGDLGDPMPCPDGPPSL